MTTTATGSSAATAQSTTSRGKPATTTASGGASDAADLLDFFDSMGVFSELNGDSLASPTLPSRAAPSPLTKQPERYRARTSGAAPLERPQRRQSSQDALSAHRHVDRIPVGIGFGTAAEASSSGPPRLDFAGESSTEEEAEELIEMPQKKCKKKKKSTNQRQKEEFAYLRGQIAEYATKLAELRGDTSSSPVPPSLWQALAQRQIASKEASELENARLRDKVKEQMRFAKALERMVRKCQAWDVREENKLQRCMQISATDSKVFETLMKSIDARIHKVEEVLASKALHGASAQQNDTEIVSDERHGLQIEFVNASRVPFDIHAISKLAWETLRLQGIANADLTTEVIDYSEDVRVAKQSMVSSGTNGRVTMARFASRRITEENRVVLVWEMLIEKKGSVLHGLPAMQVLQRGCGEIARFVEPRTGSVGSTLRSYVNLAPILDESGSTWDDATTPWQPMLQEQLLPLHQNDAKVLTERIVSCFQQTAQRARRVIENALFDEMLALQRASASPHRAVSGMKTAR